MHAPTSALPLTPAACDTSTPRLPPIDRYAGFWLALLRAAFRFMLGKVMMPLRVIFPRIPGYAFAHLCVMRFMDRGLSLPRPLVHVLTMRVSRNNACSFCFDAHQAMFMLDRPSPDALQAATRSLDDPALDPPTRAVLAYADEVVHRGEVSDATFAGLRACFDDKQLVEVVWVAALTVYLNLLARPLRIGSDGLCALVESRQRRD